MPFSRSPTNVGLDRVPEGAGDFQEFLRSLVTLVMVHHDIEAIIGRFSFVGGSDGVPGDASPRHVIKGTEDKGARKGW
jgi:hypothetical protein